MADINKLKNTFQKGTATESRDAIIELLKLAGIDDDYAASFTTTNFSFLSKELNSFGFAIDNPFIQFLNYIQSKRPQLLDVFLTPENWSVIHNAVAQGVLDSKQINFTSKELDQPKLLLNPSFWKDVSDVDKMWVLNLWEWCSTDEPNSMISHTGVRFLINTTKNGVTLNLKSVGEDKIKFQSTKELIEKESSKNIKNFDAIYSLRRALIFTSDLVSYANAFKELFTNINNKTLTDNDYSDFESQYNNIRNKINTVDLVSTKLVQPKVMSASIRACSENVQLSDRDAATGQKQKVEGSQENKEDRNQRNTRLEDSSMSYREAEDTLRQNGVDISKMTFNQNAIRNADTVGKAVATMLKTGRVR